MATTHNTINQSRIAIPALAATMANFDRATLESFVSVAIAVLDCADGDADIEEDDAAGQYDEDAYTAVLPGGYGAGCAISDNDHEHDGAEPTDDGLCGHYRADQSLAPSPALAYQPVYPDTIL